MGRQPPQLHDSDDLTLAAAWEATTGLGIQDSLLEWPPDALALTHVLLQGSEAHRFALSPPAGMSGDDHLRAGGLLFARRPPTSARLLAVLDDGEADQRRMTRSARRSLRSAVEQRQARGTKQGPSRPAPSH